MKATLDLDLLEWANLVNYAKEALDEDTLKADRFPEDDYFKKKLSRSQHTYDTLKGALDTIYKELNKCTEFTDLPF
jgi:hypothetical protein